MLGAQAPPRGRLQRAPARSRPGRASRKKAPRGREGRDVRRQATPPGRGPSAEAGAGPAGPGQPRALPLARPVIHIHEEGQGRGPGPPPCPAPRPRVQPRRRLRPQWGAPGFRPGEGVSTWSRLKNVSLPLLRPLVPALGPGEGEESGGSLPGKQGRQEGRLLLPGAGPWGFGLTAPSFAPSKRAPVIILIFKT